MVMKKGTCVLTDAVNLGDRYVIKKEAGRFYNIKTL